MEADNLTLDVQSPTRQMDCRLGASESRFSSVLCASVLLGVAACGSDSSDSGPDTSSCNQEITAGAPLTTLRGYIAFIANGQLGAVCPDGSDLRTALAPVVDTARLFMFDPSPDGRQVLVSYAQTSGAFDLIDVATATTVPMTIPTLVAGERHSDAAWSPDGRSVAYLINRQELVIGDVAAASVTNVRSFLNGQGNVFFAIASPDWASDGHRIALSEPSRTNSLGATVALVDTLAGYSRIIPSEMLNSISEPVWSPDGARLAVVAGGTTGAGIWVMDADGAHTTGLAPGTSPSWSPDGTQIVYVTGGDLWIVPSSGGPAHELVHVVQPGARAVRWVP